MVWLLVLRTSLPPTSSNKRHLHHTQAIKNVLQAIKTSSPIHSLSIIPGESFTSFQCAVIDNVVALLINAFIIATLVYAITLCYVTQIRRIEVAWSASILYLCEE